MGLTAESVLIACAKFIGVFLALYWLAKFAGHL